MPETIRCRWCVATFLKWRTLRTGRKVSGFTMLRDHIKDRHSEEADEMESILGPPVDDYDE